MVDRHDASYKHRKKQGKTCLSMMVPDLRRLACALRGALSGSWFRACEPRGVEFPCIFRAGCLAAGLRRLWRAQMAARTAQLLFVVRAPKSDGLLPIFRSQDSTPNG